MTELNQDSGALDALEAEAAARAADGDAAQQSGDSQPGESQQEAEQREAQRRNRPGRMERQIAQMQRERDDAVRYAQHAAQAAETYARQLAEAQEAGSRAAVDGMSQRIAMAEETLRQAIHAGDADAVVKAQSQLGRMHAVAAQIANAPRQSAPPQQHQLPPRQAPTEYTDTTRNWLEANSWYGQDRELTTLAKAVHAQAVRAGHAVDTPDYWDFVENGIEAIAPGTVAQRDDAVRVRTHTRTPPAGRQPAPTRNTGQTTPPRNGGEIRLTAEEADAAKISGLTPQEYRSWQTKLRAAGRLSTGAK